MKNIIILMLLLAGTVQAQLTFTDPALKAVLLSADETNYIAIINYNVSVRIDTNLDGEIQASEALLIQKLTLQAPEITSLGGIEAFANVEELSCTALGVSSVNLSGMPNLKELKLMEFPALTTVNASGLSGLTHMQVIRNPLLTSLDASGNASLNAIVAHENNLTSINITGNAALKNVNASFNQLTTFDASNLANLDWLQLQNNRLTSINVNGCTALYSLNCSGNALAALDLVRLI